MRYIKILVIAFVSLLVFQSDIIGQVLRSSKLQVEDVVFRPATWETQQLHEERNERPNKGGLIFVYYKNISKDPVRIARFLINEEGEGFFTQAGEVAWTRSFGDRIEPGETMVYEINAISENFSEGKEFSFAFIDRSWWSATGLKKVVLYEKKHLISSIIFHEDLKKFTLHLQNRSNDRCEVMNLSFSGKEILNYDLTADFIDPQGHIIVTGELEEAYEPGALCIASIKLKNNDETLTVYGHRTAYDSYFPIGTWGIEKHRYEEAKYKLHLNTFIRSGKSDDEFYTNTNKELGFKILTHTGMYPDVDKIDDLINVDDVAFWYLQDEPDANRTAEAVLFSNEMTKQRDVSKPTITTLCRNVRFFEFGFIPDVACMDHYSVGAPTSSVWPYRYGTNLEETGFYTRDLRLAAYPKPIWVWSQGLFDWNVRPRQQVPTATELTYQLLSNIGNGAKGILWFTIKENKAKKYPETYLAMQQCGRVLEMIKDDLLHGDPFETEIDANDQLLIHPIISKNRLILIVLNSDYKIDPIAYKWEPKSNENIQLKVPLWFKVRSAYELIPEEGVKETGFQQAGNVLNIKIEHLEAYRVFVFDSSEADMEKLEIEYHSLEKMEELQ